MAHDVFVSHSAKDKPTADTVCAVLEAQGIRCWVAPRDIVPGKDWGESIIDAIKGARVMVLIFSTHANDSHQIKREVERAVNKGIPVIPLRIEAIEPTASLEYFLSTPHWLDAFSPPLEKHLQYLAQIIRSIIGGTPAEPTPVAPKAKQKPEVAEAIKTEPATRTSQSISPPPSLAEKKRKSHWLATIIVVLILACLAGWYFGMHQPEQKRQAELARIQAKALAERGKQAEVNRVAQAAAAKQAAEAETARQAEAKRQADALVAQQAVEAKKAEELAAKQAAEARAKAEAEIARQAEARRQAELVAAQQAAAELAAKQAAEAKAKAAAAVASPAVSITTNNQTRPTSVPRATLSRLSLGDFNEIFGLRVGAKTNEVGRLLGVPTGEYTMGGSYHDQYLVWTYRAGGTEDLKIVFDNQTKVVRSITINEAHLHWLADHGVDDPKLSLLGMSTSDIEKLINEKPRGIYTSTVWYVGVGLDVEFLCAEYNHSKCSRIAIEWNGQ